LWAWWRQGKYVSPKSETLLGRMYEFLRNLYAFLSGNPDVTRILDQMDAGIIGRRARGTGETSSEEILRILDDETQGIRYSNAPGLGTPTATQQVMNAQ